MANPPVSPATAGSAGVKQAGAIVQIGSIFGQAAMDRADMLLQMQALQLQQGEKEFRSQQALRALRRQGEKLASEQASAYISGGVALEGSALDTLSETMNELMMAELAMQRETAYEREQVDVMTAGIGAKRRFVNRNAAIQSLSVALQSAGSTAQTM